MIFKGLSLLCLAVGVFVLMQIVMPVLAFKVWELKNFDQGQLLVDPKPAILSGNILGESTSSQFTIENINNFPAFVSKNRIVDTPFPEFRLTISRLNINSVKVLVNSNDFEKSLAHLPGSALPGERGNSFITGHSSIWPGLSQAEKALFVNLPSIKKGDEIIVDAAAQRYIYEVMGMRVVDPKDVSVINPPDEVGRYITLMTCVPPGFNLKRLIVLAKLRLT